jgi:hypothetical protein
MNRILCVIFLALSLMGCSDDPSEMGRGLIAPGDQLRIDSLAVTATGDTTFLARASGAGTTLVGLSQGIEARSAVQFSGFTTLATTVVIDSAVLVLATNYRFKDASGTLAFTVREILTTWSQDSLTWANTLDPAFATASAAYTFLQNISATDTFVTVHVDSLVRKWVATGTDAPNGLLLLPDRIATNTVAGSKPAAGLETRPTIKIYYRTTPADTEQPALALITSQRAFVASSPQPVASGELFVQGGVSYRGRITFDSLAIPAHASITKAVLELSLDNATSLTNVDTRDSLIVHLLRKNVYPFDSLALGTLCLPVLNGSQKIYRASITPIIQQWISREPNYGLVIRPYGEFIALDRFGLYGSQAAVGLRPKLTITYTVFN